MKEPDSAAFGCRVRERRNELGLSQKGLGEAAGYSQQNVVTIEAGRMKRPQRCAPALAEPLQTSTDWLLYEKGPKAVGPQYFSDKKLVENYNALDPELKAMISQAIANAKKGPHKRKSA